MFWYAIAGCIIGLLAILLSIWAYMQYSSASAETIGPDGKPISPTDAMAPAERFRALSLEDSPWGVWRPFVIVGGVWVWVCAGLALPMYGVYTQTIQTFYAGLWVAIAMPVIAGATMALLLLVELSAMIGGIGAGEVGTTQTAAAPATEDQESSEGAVRQTLTLPLQ